jgi:hypothetical protein
MNLWFKKHLTKKLHTFWFCKRPREIKLQEEVENTMRSFGLNNSTGPISAFQNKHQTFNELLINSNQFCQFKKRL